jgi:hypothetical protein
MSKNIDLSKLSKKPSDKGQHNKPAPLLPGQPGYRTRDGRSGLDPVDMRTEAAHTAGTLLKRPFSGRIRNPFALLLLAGLGLLLITPFGVAISDLKNAGQFSLYAWIILFTTGLVGMALLVNTIRNLIKIVFR